MFTIKSAAGSESFDISSDEAYKMILELDSDFDNPTGNEYIYSFPDGDRVFESGCWCPLTFSPEAV